MLVRESQGERRVECKKVGCEGKIIDRTESLRKQEGTGFCVLSSERGNFFHCNRQ